MLIYKIFHAEDWRRLQREGQTSGAPADLRDGFIHFSTAAQLSETAARHFAGVQDLTLAAFEADTMGSGLIWEPSRGGDLFAHLFGRALRLDEVLWARPLQWDGSAHVFDEGLP